MKTTKPGFKVTICSRESWSGDERWSIHAAGCRDIARERQDQNAHTETHTVTSIDEALAIVLDEETVEIGWSKKHVKVYPCCTSGKV